MSQHFLDSSALLKRYRQEMGTQWMLDLSGISDRLVVARLAQVEVTSAIVRRGREPGTTAQQIANALATLEADMIKEFKVIEFSQSVVARATVLAKAHALRAADAIQLACALLSRPDAPAPADFYLVSADDELNAAAAAEGLQVENPNLHP